MITLPSFKTDRSLAAEVTHHPQALHRRDWLIASVLAAVVIVAGSPRMFVGVCGLFHDDAIYVITARSLAEGQGYNLTNLPGSPHQTKYPILFPTVLAMVWLIWPSFPDNLLAMQALSLLSCAGAVGLGYLYMVRFRYFTRSVAAASGLLCATTPLFLYYGSQIMSEMSFALSLIIACWMLDHSLADRPRGWFYEVCLGVLLTLPFWSRIVGGIFVPCGLIVVHRAGRPTRWIAVGAALSILPWMMWTLLGLAGSNDDPSVAYYTDYLDWWSMLGLPMLVRVFSSNAAKLALSSTALGLEGCHEALFELSTRPLLLPLCVVAYVLMLSLGIPTWLPIVRQARQGRVLPCCLAGYLLVVAFWPWPPSRFVVPILMILIAYMLLGTSQLAANRISPRKLCILGLVALGVAVTANVFCLYNYSRLSHRAGHAHNWSALNPTHWRSYERQFDWLRASTQSRAVIAADRDPMFYLYTGRRGFRPFVGRPGAMFYGVDAPKLGTVDEFTHTLMVNDTEYLVVTPMRFYDQPFGQLVSQTRKRYPGWLRRVYQDPEDPRFAIYELDAESEPSTLVVSAGPSD